MTQRAEWICDGCGERAIVGKGKKPIGYNTVAITVAGAAEHHPVNGLNGTRTYDLCEPCQRRLKSSVIIGLWKKEKP